MAYGILVFLFSIITHADEVNTTDPNLRNRPDGAANMDQQRERYNLDPTGGALLIQENAVKLPKRKREQNSNSSNR